MATSLTEQIGLGREPATNRFQRQASSVVANKMSEFLEVEVYSSGGSSDVMWRFG